MTPTDPKKPAGDDQAGIAAARGRAATAATSSAESRRRATAGTKRRRPRRRHRAATSTAGPRLPPPGSTTVCRTGIMSRERKIRSTTSTSSTSTRDINLRAVIASAIVLIVVVTVSQLLMWGLFVVFEKQAAAQRAGPFAARGVAGVDAEESDGDGGLHAGNHAGPQLLTDEPMNLQQQRDKEQKVLHGLWLGRPGRRDRAHADRRGQEDDPGTRAPRQRGRGSVTDAGHPAAGARRILRRPHHHRARAGAPRKRLPLRLKADSPRVISPGRRHRRAAHRQAAGPRRPLTPMFALHFIRRSFAIAAMTAVVSAAPAIAQVGVTAESLANRRARGRGSSARFTSISSSTSQLPLDLPFMDESGKQVRLGDYFGKRPVVLALVYYECPMLCTQVLNGLVSALEVLTFDAGQGVRRRRRELRPAGDAGAGGGQEEGATSSATSGRETAAGWHFLTGERGVDRRADRGGRLPLRLGRGDRAVRARRGDRRC